MLKYGRLVIVDLNFAERLFLYPGRKNCHTLVSNKQAIATQQLRGARHKVQIRSWLDDAGRLL
jgi:hypothetical protein